MSDFLTNLVARSLGLTPTVKPLTPAMFEPSAPIVEPAIEPAGIATAPVRVHTETIHERERTLQEQTATSTHKIKRELHIETVLQPAIEKHIEGPSVTIQVPAAIQPREVPPPPPIRSQAQPEAQRIERPKPLPPASEPRTIRIHINRVDVRANFAAPAPVAPSTPKPSLAISLDDYLRQQNGGRS